MNSIDMKTRWPWAALLAALGLTGGLIPAAGAGADQEAICHIPPGNPANSRTILIASPAVSGHLAHGDTPGPCSDDDPEEPPGFSGQSVAFDGVDDIVDLGTVYDFPSAGPFSLCFWYKANSLAEAHLIGRQNPGFLRRGYFVHLDDSANVCFSLVANALSLSQRECTATVPAVGVWHHVCATVGPPPSTFASMRIYVDGVEVATNAFGTSLQSSGFSNSGANFTVGAAACASGGFCNDTNGVHTPFAFPFHGNVDEAAVYLVELTAAEVDAIYADGAPSDLGLLALFPDSWWRMGECTDASNAVVCDEGLNGFTGFLLHGAMFSTDVP